MWRTIGFASLMAGFLAFFPAEVTAQKKKQPMMELSDLATDKDYKQLQTVKDMTGKLAAINSTSITFRLDIPHMEPNPNYRQPKGGGNNNQYQHLQNIYRQQTQIMATANPVQRQFRMQQLMATMQKQQYQQMQHAARANNPNSNNQPFQLVHQNKDYELELSEKAVIRKLNLETEYTDKGDIKKYTREELAELRGKDTSKPGYQAKIEDLQVAQRVQIFLAMPKKTKPAVDKEEKDAEKDKEAEKDKAADKAKIADKADQAADKPKKANKEEGAKDEVVKPLITMIVIVQQVDAPMPAVAPAKKKKAN